MIVVSDTTPLISLLKISRLDLLEKLFGEVLIPSAVFNELTTDELNAELLLMDEAKGRNVSSQMGLQIMGTIGILMAAYEEHGLKRAGRHIGQRHYHILLSRLND